MAKLSKKYPKYAKLPNVKVTEKFTVFVYFSIRDFHIALIIAICIGL